MPPFKRVNLVFNFFFFQLKENVKKNAIQKKLKVYIFGFLCYKITPFGPLILSTDGRVRGSSENQKCIRTDTGGEGVLQNCQDTYFMDAPLPII